MSGRKEGYVYIVFESSEENKAEGFVEVEDHTGKSIRLGEWVQDGQYWNLVIKDPRESKP